MLVIPRERQFPACHSEPKVRNSLRVGPGKSWPNARRGLRDSSLPIDKEFVLSFLRERTTTINSVCARALSLRSLGMTRGNRLPD
jgi:hypothetical protein